jgi:Uma2 family endonuclease
MEIMTPSPLHENRKSLLGRLIEALTEELEIDVMGYGNMTFRLEDMEVGLEPDECYLIQHEALVRDRDFIDLAVDPPPDLAVEIDVSRSSMDRMTVYAGLGMPEVWRWDGKSDLTVWLLTSRGSYRRSQRSKAFPFLSLQEFSGFLATRGKSHTQIVKGFRAWVRKRAKQGWK